MGFFKRIKRQVSRSFRKVEKQLQRTPIVGEALREASRLAQRSEREARRARAPVAVGLGLITPFLGPFGAFTAAAAGIIGSRVQIRSAKDAAKAAKIFEIEQLKLQMAGVDPVAFGGILSGLLSAGAAPIAGGFGSFLSGLATSIGKVALPVAQQLGGAFVQREVSRIVGRPRSPTGFAPSFIPAAVQGLPRQIARPFPTPSQIFRDLPVVGRPMPRNGTRPGFTPPGTFINTPGGNVGRVFDQMPKGSDRLRAVLQADGSIAWVLVPRRRRMNVLNPRALNRAIRRVDGFAKSVMRSRKSLRRIKTV